MNRILEKISLHKKEILVSFCVAFEAFFLVGNILLGIIAFILSVVLSIFLFTKIDEQKEKIDQEISSYIFFDAFLKGIQDSLPIRSSYEAGSRYLISYQKAIPYEEIKNGNSMNLFSFQCYFDYIMEKDNQNEATLLNYYDIRRKLNHTIEEKEARYKRIMDNTNIGYIILILCLFVMVLSMCMMKFSLSQEDTIFAILLTLLSGLEVPSILLMQYLEERKIPYDKTVQ
jgi:hypothetical protein